MAKYPWEKGETKQSIIEAGDLDAENCRRLLGGKVGTDKKCRAVSLGRNKKSGNIELLDVSQD